MRNTIIKQMTGEELLGRQARGIQAVTSGIGLKAHRRVRAGYSWPSRRDAYWAGRIFAARHSARQAA